MTVERYIRIFAGLFILVSLALGVEASPLFVSPWWLAFTGFVGVAMVWFAATGLCIMANGLYWLGAEPRLVPRTVRAYCTQPVNEIDRIKTPKANDSCASGNKARPTPAIKSATKMAGNDSITSHKRMSKASIQPPRKPANKPKPTPTKTDKMTEARPTTKEMREP